MASATEEAMPATMPEPAPAALGSPSSIPVDKDLVEQIDLIKAGQDNLQQKVADKFEELEKEGQILRAIVNDIKENVKMSLKNMKDERDNFKDEADKRRKRKYPAGGEGRSNYESKPESPRRLHQRIGRNGGTRRHYRERVTEKGV